MKRTPIVAPMALLMAISFVGAVRADARPTTDAGLRTELVRYDDLDLSSPAGVDALDRRIAQAAERACSGGDVRDIDAIVTQHRCRVDARRSAQPQRDRALALADGGPIRLSSRR